MSKLENVNRIYELSDKLDSFVHSWLGIILVLVFFSTIGIGMIVVEAEGRLPKKFGIIVASICCLLIGGIILIATSNKNIKEELTSLKEEAISSIEKTTTVQTRDIVNSIPTMSRFCPHVELKENERCTYLEFVSENEITQLFIPLSSSVYANSDKPLTITYYDLSKIERKYLNYLLDTDQIAISGKHEIYSDGWSLGLSIAK